MIIVGSKLRVSDNSGARTASCIKILGGYKKKYATVGDKIVVSITLLRTKRRSQTKIAKGKVTHAVILRTKSGIMQKNGIRIRFKDNAIALINTQGKPIGTRVLGGVPSKIRYSKYMRLATLSAGVFK